MKNLETMQSTESPATMTCILLVKTGLPGWQKTMMNLFQDIQGLTFNIDAPNMLLYLSGKVDPLVVVKKLHKAETHAVLYRIDYGHEEDPQGTRKPTSSFMSCTFHLNTQEGGWHKKIIGALKTIQGASFTIDAALQLGYLSGNIDSGLLMKMIQKAGIAVYRIDYGYEPKGANLKPPFNAEREAIVANEAPTTETQTRAIHQPEASTLTSENQSKPKKPNALRRFFMSKFRFS